MLFRLESKSLVFSFFDGSSNSVQPNEGLQIQKILSKMFHKWPCVDDARKRRVKKSVKTRLELVTSSNEMEQKDNVTKNILDSRSYRHAIEIKIIRANETHSNPINDTCLK